MHLHSLCQGFAAEGTKLVRRGVYGIAVDALSGFHRMGWLRFSFVYALFFKDLIVYIRISEVNICLEHCCVDISPHDLLDDRFIVTFLEHMRDPRMPEDMRSNPFPDPCALANFL